MSKVIIQFSFETRQIIFMKEHLNQNLNTANETNFATKIRTTQLKNSLARYFINKTIKLQHFHAVIKLAIKQHYNY